MALPPPPAAAALCLALKRVSSVGPTAVSLRLVSCRTVGCCGVYVGNAVYLHFLSSLLCLLTNILIRCKFRRVDCRRGCGASVIARELDSHEQDHCRLSEHPCVFGCGEKIAKAKMDAHIKKVKGEKRKYVPQTYILERV